MLYIFGGLPGTGKSTLARRLAQRTGAAWLRVDSIEQAIRDTGLGLRGPEGYAVAQAVAVDNLRLGRPVVADTVNPIPLTRADWRGAAARAGAPFVEVFVQCSDEGEHRRRISERACEVPGLQMPDWDAVAGRQFAPWPSAAVRLDTAGQTPDQSAAALFAALRV